MFQSRDMADDNPNDTNNRKNTRRVPWAQSQDRTLQSECDTTTSLADCRDLESNRKTLYLSFLDRTTSKDLRFSSYSLLDSTKSQGSLFR